MKEEDLTREVFLEHGMLTLPPAEKIRELGDDVEILVYMDFVDENTNIQLQQKLYENEVYYALSSDGNNWWIYKNSNWIKVDPVEFYRQEWTAQDIANVPQSALMNKFDTKEVYLKMALISNTIEKPAKVFSVKAVSVQSYLIGQGYLISGEGMTLNTRHWVAIQSCKIVCSIPTDSDIRFAFANIQGEWKIYSNDAKRWIKIKEDQIPLKGMSKQEIEALTEPQWELMLGAELQLAAWFTSSNKGAPPTLTSVEYTYRAYESNPTLSNTAVIETPNYTYARKVLSDDLFIYEEFMIEGIGFEIPDEEYEFYTTPNKIKMKVLEMGTLVGAKMTMVYKCVLINTWQNKDFNVSLTFKNDEGAAIPKMDYCLIRDSDTESTMSVAELSWKDGEDFTPRYPLESTLKAQERKLFYFRMTPNTSTQGSTTAKVLVAATEI